MARTVSQDRWLRLFNHVVYNTLAPVYNALDGLTLGAWWRLVARAVEYVPPGGRVLEIGIGPGRLQTQIAMRAELSVGLDLARGMCQFAQRRLRRAGLIPRIIRGNVFDVPFPPATFDTVVSTFALAGVPHGEAALREMSRTAKRGGRVVVVDIGQPTDGNTVGVFWARLWERMGDFLYDHQALMRAAGLEVVEFEEFGPGRHVRAVVGLKT